MRRTQLYLDDHLWNALHARARSRRTTVSELVREALRERYLARRDEQMKDARRTRPAWRRADRVCAGRLPRRGNRPVPRVKSRAPAYLLRAASAYRRCLPA